MRRIPSRRRAALRPRRRKPQTTLALVLAGGILVFGYGVYHLRVQSRNATSAVAESEASLPSVEFAATSFPPSDEAVLWDVSGGASEGRMTRGVAEGVVSYTIGVSLPTPDEASGMFYEAWLVRPLPYDFFSLGALSRDVDGFFVLVWSGEPGKDYAGYAEVVITWELPDGNPAPSEHVLEGAFGTNGTPATSPSASLTP
ncbi:hypothetical protein HY734_02950 [Candidatus Uhrbacteria bacterium]|nr:hypothetical protein [Candidatus Uhrbacteria bacterium]